MKKTKNCDIKVIDDFLDAEEFTKVKEIFNSTTLPWYRNDAISDRNTTGSLLNPLDNYYFTHLLYSIYQPTSDHFNTLVEIFVPKIREAMGLDFHTFIRIKANCYIRTEELQTHPWHVDSKDMPDLMGGIFSLNTCDGYTGFIDGTTVDSVENRMVFFDSTDKHHSTSCTNAQNRLNINFNFV